MFLLDISICIIQITVVPFTGNNRLQFRDRGRVKTIYIKKKKNTYNRPEKPLKNAFIEIPLKIAQFFAGKKPFPTIILPINSFSPILSKIIFIR